MALDGAATRIGAAVAVTAALLLQLLVTAPLAVRMLPSRWR
jgi:hypothetical protein